MIKPATVGCQSVRDKHHIDSEINHIPLNELVFTNFKNGKLLDIVVSVVVFDVVVMMITCFAVCCKLDMCEERVGDVKKWSNAPGQ